MGLFIHHDFSKLLQCPGCCGVGGDVEVSDPASSDFQKNEQVENSKGSGHRDEEVASHNGLGMISYEGHPTLRTNAFPRSCVERHVASDRTRRDANV
jgi:hypothetical protein